MKRREVLSLAASIVTPALFKPASARAQAGLQFTSDARAIAIERFDGAGPGPRPAVLLLHGSDGLTSRARYELPARALATSGYTVFLPHYFDRTGERRASYGSLRPNFPAWLETVVDAYGHVARQRGIDPDRVGVFGASLGGALALALAARQSRIKAVVSYFGFLPEELRRGGRIAPTLILHGDADPVVPVSNAYAIDDLLRARGVPTEAKIYSGQGHGFTGAALADAVTRTSVFLDRYLAGA